MIMTEMANTTMNMNIQRFDVIVKVPVQKTAHVAEYYSGECLIVRRYASVVYAVVRPSVTSR